VRQGEGRGLRVVVEQALAARKHDRINHQLKCCHASANVTAGLKCPPEIGPNVSICDERCSSSKSICQQRKSRCYPPQAVHP
jgi:hypothetical protein